MGFSATMMGRSLQMEPVSLTSGDRTKTITIIIAIAIANKRNWFRKGGYDVPLFVPHTPRGILAKTMREKEAQNNQGRRIRFKIVEKGGVTLEQMLRRSNPWGKDEKCGRPRCFPCRGERGGNC